MKKLLTAAMAVALLGTACTQQKQESAQQQENREETAEKREGEELYSKVRKFVAIGEHRTGTEGDIATTEWLRKELETIGARAEYIEFTLKQFLFANGLLSAGDQKAEVFPVWPVKEGLNLSPDLPAIDGDNVAKLSDVKGKLVLTRLKNQHGGSTPEIAAQINRFINAGASGVLAVTENNTGELVALNTYKGQQAWEAPVYHLAPKDTGIILNAIAGKANVSINIQGEVKEVKARNVLGKIGNGKKHIVISTPVSGWFRTGGERGPGIAVWLGLARWASQNASKYPDYTFVFTGHSGHELSILGAEVFVDSAAPKPEDTRLWIHLGAGIAVRSWKEENGKWTLTDSVDGKRGIYYASSVAPAFEKAFANIEAKKVKGTPENSATVKPGGEGILFRERGYANLVSLSYSHRLHHVRSDDESATSPALLEEIERALQNFIAGYLESDQSVALKR